jgi:hypothetical protein
VAKRAAQVRSWQTVECTVCGETVTKLDTAFLATYPPIGRMIRVVLEDEDYGSIGDAQHGFSEVQMDGFLYFHHTLVLIVCQYIFIVICGPECAILRR